MNNCYGRLFFFCDNPKGSCEYRKPTEFLDKGCEYVSNEVIGATTFGLCSCIDARDEARQAVGNDFDTWN